MVDWMNYDRMFIGKKRKGVTKKLAKIIRSVISDADELT